MFGRMDNNHTWIVRPVGSRCTGTFALLIYVCIPALLYDSAWRNEDLDPGDVE
jgi:hypothetical protein